MKFEMSESGGPWGNGGGRGPWGGSRPEKPNDSLDLDQIIQSLKKTFHSFFSSHNGGGNNEQGKNMILSGFVVFLALVVIWLLSGLYRIQPGEQGIVTLFGRYYSTTGPGLNYWFPAPIGQVFKPNVEVTNQISVGYRGSGDVNHGVASVDVPEESLMLTGDQNIIDIDFVVQWRIKNAAHFLFNIRDPEQTIKMAAESVMREVIGDTTLQEALTGGRQQVEQQAMQALQNVLDDYQAGVFIADVKLQQSDPPKEVIDAFNDVQRARQDRERSQNEALAYRNNIVPRAKGEGERKIQNAKAYKEKLIKESEGEAKRFLSVYETYKKAKNVTMRRLYLENLEAILQKSDKIIIDKKASQGMVPYLPLPGIKKGKAQGGND